MRKALFHSLIVTGITFIGSFLPVISAFFIFKIKHSIWPELIQVVGNGEISIICIPIAFTIIFTLYQYKKDIGIYKWPDAIFFITIIFTSLALIIYPYYNNQELVKGNLTLFTFSIIFFFWALVAFGISKTIENLSIGKSLSESRETDQSKLEKKYQTIKYKS
jgi:hypothetical protein